MRIIYTLCLLKKGIAYLGYVNKRKDFVYGYKKSTDQYFFFTCDEYGRLKVSQVCDSKAKALFVYKILAKGV